MVTKIAVCDDSLAVCTQICDFLKRVELERQEEFDICCFSSAEELLMKMPEDTQILFLDIVMQGESGMQAAHRLRETDRSLCIIFITSMVQYALDGYGVRAFGFLKKPLEYLIFRREVLDALDNIARRQGKRIVLRAGGQVCALSTSEILYAEILGRELKIVTEDDAQFYAITLKEFEQMVDGCGFFRCHKSYLVNFRYVLNIGINEVVLANRQTIPLSRHRRKEFVQSFAAYVGNHGTISQSSLGPPS